MPTGASFDISRLLPLYARVNEAGSPITITFVDAAGGAVDISGEDFELPVYKRPQSTIPEFTMTVGSGLTVGGAGSNELSIAPTALQATVRPDTYFWRLYSSASDNTWLNGPFYFHKGEFDGVNDPDDFTITVSGTPVTVTISGVTAASQAEANAGTEAAKYVSPKTLAEKVEVVTASGTDTYTATVPGTLTTGRRVFVLFTNANTGPSTLNGTAIKKSVSSSLASGDISAGEIKLIAYDGSNFQIVGGSGGGTGDLVSTNNLSDVASVPSSRANLDVAHDRITVTDKSSGFNPVFTDFETTGVKTNPLYRCTASFTVTLDQDSTDSIPVGFTIFGMTMSTYTTTFAAGSGATVETSSGGSTVVASATEGFVLWSATKRAANTWSVQNGRAPSGSFSVIPMLSTTSTFTNWPASEGEIISGATTGRFRNKFDLTNFTSIKVIASASVAAAQGNLYPSYSTDQSSWTTIGTGTGSDKCSPTSIGINESGWITIPAGAKSEVYLRVLQQGGSGSSPNAIIGNIHFLVK